MADSLRTLIERPLSRRLVLQLGAAQALVPWWRQDTASRPTKLADRVHVPLAYRLDELPLLRWGDPIDRAVTSFDPTSKERAKRGADAQAMSFGYNCDFVAFLPLPLGSGSSERGLLVVNHEYANAELMFPAAEVGADKDLSRRDRDTMRVELMAHGLSVVEVRRRPGSGAFDVVRPGGGMADASLRTGETCASGACNRRIHGETTMRVTGPAATHAWMRTAEDPTGTLVRGTLANCAGGVTPWGTVLTCEENFHYYFGGPATNALHRRYGVPSEERMRSFHRLEPRFDLACEPNEPNRFGWVVEIDPFEPTSVPRKHSALGRFRHEAATVVLADDARVVVYSGDDEADQFIYKFVSAARVAADDRAHNLRLLEDGTLHVARLEADGTGKWLPLTMDTCAAHGFQSLGEIMIDVRRAAAALGATPMDRPEDLEASPHTSAKGFVYAVMTNHKGKKAPTIANPRAPNPHGHILELREAGDDHAATSFQWRVFLLGTEPSGDAPFVPADALSCPDNLAFDRRGNLWIATDGQPKSLAARAGKDADQLRDGLFMIDTVQRSGPRHFLAGPIGAEICGPAFTPDNRTLFVAIQHPGEGEWLQDKGWTSTFDKPLSSWPEKSGPPRPSVVCIWKKDGGAIGAEPFVLEPS